MATATATFPRNYRRPRAPRSAAQQTFPEVFFVKRVDNSRLRREVDPAKRRECFLALGLSSVVFVLLLLFAWQHFQCVQYGYQLQDLKAQKATLEEWNHRLRLEQASLADPQRIDVLARQRLGLVPLSPQQVIQMAPEQGLPAEGTVLARNRNWHAPALATGVANLSREQ